MSAKLLTDEPQQGVLIHQWIGSSPVKYAGWFKIDESGEIVLSRADLADEHDWEPECLLTKVIEFTPAPGAKS
jgi:hypothetical protein